MFFPPLIALLFLAPPDGLSTAVVVATQTEPALQERMLRVKNWSEALGVTVLDTTEVMRRLTLQPNPQLVDLEAIKKRVTAARELELRFDRSGAIAAREELLNTYDNAVVPDFKLQAIIAHVLHDAVGAALELHQTKVAQDAARMAQRRFPNVATEGGMPHAREIAAMLYRATVELKRASTTEVTVTSTKPGRVMADGAELGTIDTTMTVKLAPGTWIFWMFDANGQSLPHFVTVTEQPMRVDIDFALEANLSWTPVPTFRCSGVSCNEALRTLAKRLGVTEAVGLSLDNDEPRQPAIGNVVRADDGSVESRPVIALEDLFPPQSYFVKAEAEAAKPDYFSAWSLGPFGVGQYAQGRFVAGTAFLSTGVGLGVWHIIAGNSYGNFRETSPSHAHALRTQQNVSAGLLVGVALVSIGEAIYWGIKHPTYPAGTTAPPTETALQPQPEAAMSVNAP